jgi:hypothetical protein
LFLVGYLGVLLCIVMYCRILLYIVYKIIYYLIALSQLQRLATESMGGGLAMPLRAGDSAPPSEKTGELGVLLPY